MERWSYGKDVMGIKKEEGADRKKEGNPGRERRWKEKKDKRRKEGKETKESEGNDRIRKGSEKRGECKLK